MGSYEDAVQTLEVEPGRVEQAFRDLRDEQWQTPTKLQPLDEAQPPWTVFELAGHFDISIGLTVMLMAEPQTGQVGRDRTSFFIFPRSEVAPVVYDYAHRHRRGRRPDRGDPRRPAGPQDRRRTPGRPDRRHGLGQGRLGPRRPPGPSPAAHRLTRRRRLPRHRGARGHG
jgi:hypothetical protein